MSRHRQLSGLALRQEVWGARVLGHGGAEAGIGAGSVNGLMTGIERSWRRGSWSPRETKGSMTLLGWKIAEKGRDLFGSVNVRGFSTREMPGAVSLPTDA